jgi:hypothetical protein
MRSRSSTVTAHYRQRPGKFVCSATMAPFGAVVSHDLPLLARSRSVGVTFITKPVTLDFAIHASIHGAARNQLYTFISFSAIWSFLLDNAMVRARQVNKGAPMIMGFSQLFLYMEGPLLEHQNSMCIASTNLRSATAPRVMFKLTL